MITGDLAKALPRFEFIAAYLVAATKRKADRGPLGYWVRKRRGAWEIVSPIGGATVVYTTKDPALLYDYARRMSWLGYLTKSADAFRVEALTRAPFGDAPR